MVDKVIDHKYPGAADLGAGYKAGLSASAQFLWVAAQYVGGFAEPKGLHRQWC